MGRVYFKYKDYKIDSRDSFYNEYKEKGGTLSGLQVAKVFKFIQQEILEEISKNPDGFELHSGLGFLQMIGIKLKKISDAHYTYKLRAKKYKLLRTDNYVYGVYWLRSNNAFRNVQYWSSETGKLIKTKITEWVKKDKKFNVIKLEHRKDVVSLITANHRIREMNKGLKHES